MIRRMAATLLLTAAGAGAGLALAGTAHAEPSPSSNGPAVLSNITIGAPINLPIAICASVQVATNPSGAACPGKSGPEGAAPAQAATAPATTAPNATSIRPVGRGR